MTNIVVNDNDVLCGRGGATNNHAGNRKFREMVVSYQPTYLAARKPQKKQIAREIVTKVREYGGRFLRKENDVWVDVGDTKATEKTSQTLREGLDVRATTKGGGKAAVASPEATAATAVSPEPAVEYTTRTTRKMKMEMEMEKSTVTMTDAQTSSASTPSTTNHMTTSTPSKTTTRNNKSHKTKTTSTPAPTSSSSSRQAHCSCSWPECQKFQNILMSTSLHGIVRINDNPSSERATLLRKSIKRHFQTDRKDAAYYVARHHWHPDLVARNFNSTNKINPTTPLTPSEAERFGINDPFDSFRDGEGNTMFVQAPNMKWWDVKTFCETCLLKAEADKDHDDHDNDDVMEEKQKTVVSAVTAAAAAAAASGSQNDDHDWKLLYMQEQERCQKLTRDIERLTKQTIKEKEKEEPSRKKPKLSQPTTTTTAAATSCSLAPFIGLNRLTLFSDVWHNHHPQAARQLFGLADSWEDTKQCITTLFPQLSYKTSVAAAAAPDDDVQVDVELTDFEKCLIAKLTLPSLSIPSAAACWDPITLTLLLEMKYDVIMAFVVPWKDLWESVRNQWDHAMIKKEEEEDDDDEEEEDDKKDEVVGTIATTGRMGPSQGFDLL